MLPRKPLPALHDVGVDGARVLDVEVEIAIRHGVEGDAGAQGGHAVRRQTGLALHAQGEHLGIAARTWPRTAAVR